MSEARQFIPNELGLGAQAAGGLPPATDQIATALSKAQGEMTHATLDKVNPHFRSKYASLQSVITAVRESLAKHEIAFLQQSRETQSGVTVETVFYHSSGQSLASGPVFVPVDKQSAHGVGSALTYAKRYSLAMACGISDSDDDDGNTASGNPPKSVVQTVIDEMEIEVDQEKAAEYVAGISASIFNEDDVGLFQLLDELAEDNDMKTVVWSGLDSKQRTKITKLQKARE